MAAAGESVAITENVDAFLDAVDDGSHPPACVILGGVRLDKALGESIAMIRARIPTVPIVAISPRAGAGDIKRAIGFGVEGVVLEKRIEDALVPAVEAVRSGQTSVPSARLAELGSEVLTGREKEVLALVAAGLSNAEIATRLYLAESTVKSHLSSAFGKLNVSSRHEAASLILDPERGRSLGIPLPAELRGAAAHRPHAARAASAA
jgi:DNA-binding NarL/FixJ family response regulator